MMMTMTAEPFAKRVKATPISQITVSKFEDEPFENIAVNDYGEPPIPVSTQSQFFKDNSIKTRTTWKKMADKNRFVFSKETQKEFKIKPRDIPKNNRLVLDETAHYTDHILQNIRMTEKYNDVSKVMYMTRMKKNLSAQTGNKLKAIQNEEQVHRVNKDKLSKWDNFRERREMEMDRYLKAKRL